MTTAVEPDTRGVDALSDEMDDIVAVASTPIFDELFEEMYQELTAVDPEAILADEFDEQPWRQLPTIEDLQNLWSSVTPLDQTIASLAAAAHHKVADVPQYLAQQRWLAEMELAFKKGRVDDGQAETGAVDAGRPGEAAALASAAADGSVSDLPGGPEDGDTVGAGGQAAQPQDPGPASPVSRKRRPRKAS